MSKVTQTSAETPDFFDDICWKDRFDMSHKYLCEPREFNDFLDLIEVFPYLCISFPTFDNLHYSTYGCSCQIV